MSAPTTEEVKGALKIAKAALEASPGASLYAGVVVALESPALPLAEHRDALNLALTKITAAAGLPADASVEEVVAQVKERRWMVSAICNELFCHKEMPIPDALTIQRIDGITRRHEPGPFDEALFEEAAPVRERLEAIQAARHLLATERIAVHRDGFKYIISATTHECLGDWDLVGSTGKRLGPAWVRLNGKIVTAPEFKDENEARDWVFKKL